MKVKEKAYKTTNCIVLQDPKDYTISVWSNPDDAELVAKAKDVYITLPTMGGFVKMPDYTPTKIGQIFDGEKFIDVLNLIYTPDFTGAEPCAPDRSNWKGIVSSDEILSALAIMERKQNEIRLHKYDHIDFDTKECKEVYVPTLDKRYIPMDLPIFVPTEKKMVRVKDGQMQLVDVVKPDPDLNAAWRRHNAAKDHDLIDDSNEPNYSDEQHVLRQLPDGRIILDGLPEDAPVKMVDVPFPNGDWCVVAMPMDTHTYVLDDKSKLEFTSAEDTNVYYGLEQPPVFPPGLENVDSEDIIYNYLPEACEEGLRKMLYAEVPLSTDHWTKLPSVKEGAIPVEKPVPQQPQQKPDADGKIGGLSPETRARLFGKQSAIYNPEPGDCTYQPMGYGYQPQFQTDAQGHMFSTNNKLGMMIPADILQRKIEESKPNYNCGDYSQCANDDEHGMIETASGIMMPVSVVKRLAAEGIGVRQKPMNFGQPMGYQPQQQMMPQQPMNFGQPMGYQPQQPMNFGQPMGYQPQQQMMPQLRIYSPAPDTAVYIQNPDFTVTKTTIKDLKAQNPKAGWYYISFGDTPRPTVFFARGTEVYDEKITDPGTGEEFTVVRLKHPPVGVSTLEGIDADHNKTNVSVNFIPLKKDGVAPTPVDEEILEDVSLPELIKFVEHISSKEAKEAPTPVVTSTPVVATDGWRDKYMVAWKEKAIREAEEAKRKAEVEAVRAANVMESWRHAPTIVATTVYYDSPEYVHPNDPTIAKLDGKFTREQKMTGNTNSELLGDLYIGKSPKTLQEEKEKEERRIRGQRILDARGDVPNFVFQGDVRDTDLSKQYNESSTKMDDYANSPCEVANDDYYPDDATRHSMSSGLYLADKGWVAPHTNKYSLMKELETEEELKRYWDMAHAREAKKQQEQLDFGGDVPKPTFNERKSRRVAAGYCPSIDPSFLINERFDNRELTYIPGNTSFADQQTEVYNQACYPFFSHYYADGRWYKTNGAVLDDRRPYYGDDDWWGFNVPVGKYPGPTHDNRVDHYKQFDDFYFRSKNCAPYNLKYDSEGLPLQYFDDNFRWLKCIEPSYDENGYAPGALPRVRFKYDKENRKWVRLPMAPKFHEDKLSARPIIDPNDPIFGENNRPKDSKLMYITRTITNADGTNSVKVTVRFLNDKSSARELTPEELERFKTYGINSAAANYISKYRTAVDPCKTYNRRKTEFNVRNCLQGDDYKFFSIGMTPEGKRIDPHDEQALIRYFALRDDAALQVEQPDDSEKALVRALARYNADLAFELLWLSSLYYTCQMPKNIYKGIIRICQSQLAKYTTLDPFYPYNHFAVLAEDKTIECESKPLTEEALLGVYDKIEKNGYNIDIAAIKALPTLEEKAKYIRNMKDMPLLSREKDEAYQYIMNNVNTKLNPHLRNDKANCRIFFCKFRNTYSGEPVNVEEDFYDWWISPRSTIHTIDADRAKKYGQRMSDLYNKFWFDFGRRYDHMQGNPGREAWLADRARRCNELFDTITNGLYSKPNKTLKELDVCNDLIDKYTKSLTAKEDSFNLYLNSIRDFRAGKTGIMNVVLARQKMQDPIGAIYGNIDSNTYQRPIVEYQNNFDMTDSDLGDAEMFYKYCVGSVAISSHKEAEFDKMCNLLENKGIKFDRAKFKTDVLNKIEVLRQNPGSGTCASWEEV